MMINQELEEINITEKQKVKELEIIEMTDKDVKLVHVEEYDEIININIVDENREPIFETEKVIIENIEIEAAQKCDKKLIRDKDKIDKITKESLQNNRKVEQNFERSKLEETKNFQEEEYDEMVNNNTEIGNREPIIETLMTEKILIENIEIEGTLECDMKLIEEKYKLDQITEESLKNNRIGKIFSN